jgi:hypothetical protein
MKMDTTPEGQAFTRLRHALRATFDPAAALEVAAAIDALMEIKLAETVENVRAQIPINLLPIR